MGINYKQVQENAVDINDNDISSNSLAFPPGFESLRKPTKEYDNHNEIEDGELEIQVEQRGGLEIESEDDVLKEAKKSRKMTKESVRILCS